MFNISDIKGKKEKEITEKKKSRRSKKKRIIFIIILLLIAAAALLFFRSRGQKTTVTEVDAKNIGTVDRGNVTQELSSSGLLEAKDSYEITSLVEGEIIEANFEEGDMVEEGQVLYVIDPSDMERELESAERSLENAEKSLEDAKADYAKLSAEFAGNVYRSKVSGYIKNISVKSGDSVGGQNGTQIADLYNDKTMEVRIPFLTGEANALQVGSQGILTIADTGEQIPGVITSIAGLEETLTGGTLVKYVTIQVTNPGGLSTSDTATAQFGDIYSAGDGSFEPCVEDALKCDLSQSAKVETVLVKEGDFISVGTPLFSLTADSVADALKNSEDALDNAQNSYDNAVDQYDNQQDNLEDYIITAPISGTVIEKNSKAGDKISRSGNSETTMAIIYDLSELTFEMSIDELDISDVEVGQTVEITADAFEDETYTGHVTNVSMNGSYSNGVTTYPVTVTLDDSGDLMPGMTVDGIIILNEAEDTLRIPAGALHRGNIVYVKNDSIEADEAAGKTVGISQSQAATDEKIDESSEAMAEMPGNMPSGMSEGTMSDGAPDSMPEGASESMPEGGEAPSAIPSGAPEGFTAVRVETGLISDEYVEIISGLNEGDEIYVEATESNSMGMMFGMPGGGRMTISGGPGGGPGGGR